MINWNGRNAIISSYWVCLFTKFRWRLHRALRLAWITWIPFILWFSMIFKIGLNIVHGFMNATFIDDSLYQWSLTINVHSCIYEHTSCMINDHRNSYEHWSCMINDLRNNYEHWSSMIIDIDYDSWRSMIVAMKCCWSYMISVDHCIISWPLVCMLRKRWILVFSCLLTLSKREQPVGLFRMTICVLWWSVCHRVTVFTRKIKAGPICPTFIRGDPFEPQKPPEKVSFRYLKMVNPFVWHQSR